MIEGGGVASPPRRVCFFGTYPREYTVTRLLFQACAAAGIEVRECHRALWERTRHKEAAYFAAASGARLLREYLRHAVALRRARRAIGDVSLYLVGFNGQLDSLLLRLLLWRDRTPMVFAPLVTATETLIDDRAVFASRSIRGALTRALDRVSLHAASRVILDTNAHREYVIRNFGIDPQRVSTWYLGADPTVFRATPVVPHAAPIRVVFYGSFLPLHGTEIILHAAELLKDDANVELIMIGDGAGHAAAAARARAAGLTRVHFAGWVPYESLGQTVAGADVCLGIFGTTAKAQMVIPNKVYQAAAVGRAVITADTPAVREVFAHGETAWLCPLGDPSALAAAVRTMAADSGLRERLGRQAAELMARCFSPQAQGERLAQIFAATVNEP